MTTDDGHVWRTRSCHPTSDQVVSYQSCHCGLWRILVKVGGGTVVADRIGAGGPLPDRRPETWLT